MDALVPRSPHRLSGGDRGTPPTYDLYAGRSLPGIGKVRLVINLQTAELRAPMRW